MTGTSCSFKHSAEGETYYYRVKTNTGTEDSDWSNTIIVVIKNPLEDIGITMISIPAGSFVMGDLNNAGSSDEKPVHTVTLSAFEMSETEVTQGQYKAITGPKQSYFSGSDDLPVERVTWYDTVKFCNSLSDYAGLDRCYNESTWECDFTKNDFRLPTEAEWEYACRAGTTTKYYTGNSGSDLGRAGWYYINSSSKTHPVGQKESNAWGLYDIHGNVREWCHDWYDRNYYNNSPAHNPIGAQSGSYRVFRGGAWIHDANYCRTANRDYTRPTDTNFDLGFRVVRRFLP